MNTIGKPRRLLLISALLAAIALSDVNAAWAEPVVRESSFATVPGMAAGRSPDGLGTWSVHYQRMDGGNPEVATAINEHIDAAAMRQVQQATWDASTKRTWTFNTTGTAQLRPNTVSELFVGQYNTAEPNMPIDTVATIVFDSRSGIPITLDNLFHDKAAGLARLSEQAEAILPTVYSTAHPGDWKRGGALAPTDINFENWLPTAEGIELHFPDYQFGRGLKVVTVPWADVEDLIAPEFLSIKD
jgi:hypothetical protein